MRGHFVSDQDASGENKIAKVYTNDDKKDFLNLCGLHQRRRKGIVNQCLEFD